MQKAAKSLSAPFGIPVTDDTDTETGWINLLTPRYPSLCFFSGYNHGNVACPLLIGDALPLARDGTA